MVKTMCRRWDLNPHPLRDTALNRARLPIPPLRPFEELRVYYIKKCASRKLFAGDFVDGGVIEENQGYFFNEESLKIKIDLLSFLHILSFSSFL